MLRFACLLLSLSGAPSLCEASPAAPAASAVRSAPVDDCKVKASEPAAVEEAAPTDAPARGTAEAAGATSSPGRVRAVSPRWQRALPGMFR